MEGVGGCCAGGEMVLVCAAGGVECDLRYRVGGGVGGWG